MGRGSALLSGLLLLGLSCLPAPACAGDLSQGRFGKAGNDRPEVIPGEFVVTFDPTTTATRASKAADTLASEMAGVSIRFKYGHVMKGFAFNLGPAASEEAVLARVR